MSALNRNDQLVSEYLERIERALRDLPPDRRDSIVEDIREHIRIARSQLPSEDEVQIRQLLDDMGDPEAIRAEAGLQPIARSGGKEVWAPWLLLFGGFVLLVGWLAGLVLLWNSSIWRTRDKVLATLIWPGGLATVVYAGGIVGMSPVVSQCTGGAGIVAHCTSHPELGTFPMTLGIMILLVGVAAPVVINVRLMRIRHRLLAK